MTTGRRALVSAIGAWIVIPGFLFATAGTVRWWPAWAYSLALLVPMTVFLAWAARNAPAFLERRLRAAETDPAQQRIVRVSYPVFLAAYVLPGVDHRFGWSHVPDGVVLAALLVTLVSYLGVLRVFLENPWARRTVETSGDQQLIDTGPYAIVRHPMYTCVTVMYLASPVALGSWWALIPAFGVLPILVVRTIHEERTLRAGLPGYPAYAERVRWRMFPGVW